MDDEIEAQSSSNTCQVTVSGFRHRVLFSVTQTHTPVTAAMTCSLTESSRKFMCFNRIYSL